MRSRRRTRTGSDTAFRTVRRTRPPVPGTGVAALAVAAGLALSGCGSGGGHGDADRTPTASVTGSGPATTPPTPSGPATTTDSPTGTPTDSPSDGSAAGDHGVEGVWLATAGGTKVQLVLGKGKAGLTSTSLCGGTYTEHGGLGLNLTCMDGSKERTTGHGTLAADGKTLTVQWADGPTDTFSRTGLPSN